MPDIPPLDLRDIEEGAVLKVSVLPKSSREELAGIHDRALRLRLTAPPVEGAANAACIAFLSRLLRIPKSRLLIIRGHHSRQKWIRIQGVTSERILEHLKQLGLF
jgi:uncharacterized protein (TIGR00251 family)